MSATALKSTNRRFSSLNCQNFEMFCLVPRSPTHTGLICEKTLKPNISNLGPFKHTRWIFLVENCFGCARRANFLAKPHPQPGTVFRTPFSLQHLSPSFSVISPVNVSSSICFLLNCVGDGNDGIRLEKHFENSKTGRGTVLIYY
jgi:hypothetical protein